MEEKIETYAVIELMGHTRLIGRVMQSNLVPSILRVDVLDSKGGFQYTKHIGTGAIYAISEIAKDEAIALAKEYSAEPSFAYTIKRLLLQANDSLEPDLSEDEDYEQELRKGF